MTRFHLTRSECEVLFDIYNGRLDNEEDWEWFSNEVSALVDYGFIDEDGFSEIGELVAEAIGEADWDAFPEGLCFFFYES